jgi:hypothetical protein
LPSPPARRILTDGVRRFLKDRGYAINRFPFAEQAPLDVRRYGNDPRSIVYDGRPVLVDAPMWRGRGLHNYSLHREGPHPFVRAAAAMLHLDHPDGQTEAMRRLLSAYYARVQPATFAEWMGLSARGSALDRIPAWAAPFPWETRGVESTRRDRAKAARAESLRGGVELPISAGWQFVGPAVPEKIDLEVRRLQSLTNSLQRSGFRRSDARQGDVTAVVLWRADARDDAWRWIVHDGHHRAAVASALGLDAIPVRVVRVVRRDEATLWPGVVSGLYPLDSALEVFDGQFSERPSPIAEPWLDFLEQTRLEGYRTCRAGPDFRRPEAR